MLLFISVALSTSTFKVWKQSHLPVQSPRCIAMINQLFTARSTDFIQALERPLLKCFWGRIHILKITLKMSYSCLNWEQIFLDFVGGLRICFLKFVDFPKYFQLPWQPDGVAKMMAGRQWGNPETCFLLVTKSTQDYFLDGFHINLR